MKSNNESVTIYKIKYLLMWLRTQYDYIHTINSESTDRRIMDEFSMPCLLDYWRI